MPIRRYLFSAISYKYVARSHLLNGGVDEILLGYALFVQLLVHVDEADHTQTHAQKTKMQFMQNDKNNNNKKTYISHVGL